MKMVVTTVLLTLGKLVQIFSVLLSACPLKSGCSLLLSTAPVPGPAMDLLACSSAPIPRHALASSQRKLVHVGDGCAYRSPGTNSVGRGCVPWDKDCREHLPSDVDTAPGEPSLRRVSGIVNALLAEQVSVMQCSMCW